MLLACGVFALARSPSGFSIGLAPPAKVDKSLPMLDGDDDGGGDGDGDGDGDCDGDENG